MLSDVNIGKKNIEICIVSIKSQWYDQLFRQILLHYTY